MSNDAGPRPPVARVVVCAGTQERRHALHRALDDEHLQVVGEARRAQDVEPLLRRLGPALLVLDLDLPDGGAPALLERLMAVRPLPVVVCHDGTDPGADARLLAAGAVDAVVLPPGLPGPDDVARLRAAARTAARARVITHPRGHLPATVTPLAPRQRTAEPGPVELLVVGSSTGGPAALGALVARLPEDFAPAVVLVQHMGEGFLEGLAAWLDVRCALPVSVAADGDRLVPGTVVLAPGGGNLLVEAGMRLRLAPAPSTQFHRPGVDATMVSAAAVAGPRTVGVVLTGMGRDGAAGLLALRSAGAGTLAQARTGCAVYGMPAAAVEAGAVQEQLPLETLVERVVELCGRRAVSPRTLAAGAR